MITRTTILCLPYNDNDNDDDYEEEKNKKEGKGYHPTHNSPQQTLQPPEGTPLVYDC